MPTAENVISEPILDIKTAVVQALEDSRYDWRTVAGLVRSLHVSEPQILTVLSSISDMLVRTYDSEGKALFTTRNHYEKTHGFGEKLLSALADKIVA